ncbi:UNVERIFIED_CONTAM: hypothetical protein FKN15_063282 [Acipenser sinensis]
MKPKKSALHQLTKSLLRNYRKGVRPVRNWTQSTMVYIDFITQSILEVIWNDEFLVWDPAEFDGINEISLSFDVIWVPDIIISEFVDVGSSPDMPYVYVNSSGMIKNYRPIQVVSACSLEIYAFPFDRQNCTLTFRSWLHTVNEVNLTLWRSLEDVANDKSAFMNEGEWELISVPSRYEQLHLDSRDYAQIQFNVVIRRRPLLYVVSLLIPSLFLMIVDVMSFYLPANSGTRITFKTSILLGYTLFRVNISNELPATAIKTPLIGVFFAVCMALLVLSLAKSILVVKLLYHSEKPVKDMSVSACLLDKYGSYSQSIKDGGGQSRGYQFEVSPKVEMTPSSGELSKNILLEKILREIVALKHYLEQIDDAGSMTVEWLALCYKLDKFLFRLYLFILAIYIIKDINISLLRSPEEVMFDKSVFMNQGEWELLHILSAYSAFSIDGKDHYAEMKFSVVIRRRPLFYTVSLLLPSIFLMVMDIVGFFLPPDSGERVSFKITLLLGYSVFLIIVSDTLPATAIGTPLIGVYFVVCMALLVISLTETILIVRLVHKQDLQPHVPEWVKYLVLERATVLFCIRNKHKFGPLHPKEVDVTQYKENNINSDKLNFHCCENPKHREKPMGMALPLRENTLVVDSILHEISFIRQYLEKRDEYRDIAKEWLQVGYVLDVLLFRVYLVAVLAYSITLGTLWSVWQYAE